MESVAHKLGSLLSHPRFSNLCFQPGFQGTLWLGGVLQWYLWFWVVRGSTPPTGTESAVWRQEREGRGHPRKNTKLDFISL